MDINEATARAIAAERAISGMTVRELAERAGIPLSSLMRVLKAQREIKVMQVEQLATAFGVYPHEIIERAEVILARSDSDPASNVYTFPARDEGDGATVGDDRAVANEDQSLEEVSEAHQQDP